MYDVVSVTLAALAALTSFGLHNSQWDVAQKSEA